MAGNPEDLRAAWRRHARRWADNRYVYAVVSRRSGGLSVGVNLNPDKGCNFDCIYCQVDRAIPPVVRRVDLDVLARELDLVLAAAQDGRLFDEPPLSALPPGRRDVRDIAFSGDGEPTTCPVFEDALKVAADARRRFRLGDTKIVLITDAAYLNRASVRAGLRILDENNGEIWAKLDAGTQSYFERVNRPNVPLRIVLDNITEAARARPIVVQSLWMRIDGEGPPQAEIDAFCDRLGEVLDAGGQIKAIQLYTIARTPAMANVTELADADLDAIAAVVRARVPVAAEIYYGVSGQPLPPPGLPAQSRRNPDDA